MSDFFDDINIDVPENDFSNLTPGDIGVTDPGFDNGSFGNNGGSVGDNGAGGGSGEEPGNAGTSGAPTQDDYQNLVKQFGTTTANQIMQQVVKDNPNWSNLIKSFVPNLTTPPGGTTTTPPGGSGPGTTNMGMLIPALAQAFQQWNQAGEYQDTAERYAKDLNPYGAYRDAAAQKLAALQADPSSIVDTPGYKFNLSQGLGAVANRDNRSYGVGAGSTNPDMMNFASGLASKTYNDTIKQYSDQAGVGIGPSAAAGMLETGLQGKMNSQNQALQALFSPFGPGNNTGGSTGGVNIFDPSSWGRAFGGAINGIDWNKILGNANGGGGSTGTQDTTQTTNPDLPASNGSYGSYTGGA